MSDAPSTSPPPEKLHELVTRAILAVQITRYTLLASAFMIFYDYVVSFDREVELIWGKRWSIIKVVFIWHRYFGIFCAIFELSVFMNNDVNDSNPGNFWVRWETWGYSAVVLTTELVLLLWIFVVYNRSRWILAFASFLLLAQIAAVSTILAKSFSNFRAQANLLPLITFCLVVHEPSFFHIFWTPILAYHTIIFVMFLLKGWSVYYRGGRREFMGTGLLETIYKDSLVNFLSIFAAYLSCAVMWLAADPFLAQVPVGFALSLSITSCTRLLLNIRQAYYTRVEFDSHISTRHVFISGHGDRSESRSTSILFADEDPKSLRAPSIYIENTSRDLWAFELREMKWAGTIEG